MLQVGGDIDDVLMQGNRHVTHPFLLLVQVDHPDAGERACPRAIFEVAQGASRRIGRAEQLVEFRIRIAAGAVNLDFFPAQGAVRYAEGAAHPADKTFAEVEHRIARVIVAQGRVRAGGQEPLPVDMQDIVQLTTVGVGHPGNVDDQMFIHDDLTAVDDIPVGVRIPLHAGEARHVRRRLAPVNLNGHLGVVLVLREAQDLRIDGRLIKRLHAEDVMGQGIFVVAVVHRRAVAGGPHVRHHGQAVVVDHESRLVVVIVLAAVRRVLEHHGPAVFRTADNGDAVVRIVIVSGLPDRLRETQPRIAVEKRRQAGARLAVINDGEHPHAGFIPGAGVGKLIQIRIHYRVLERYTVVKGRLGVIGHEQV